MAPKTRRTILSQDGKRKVEIFQRQDGTFGFEEYFYDTEDKAWCPRSPGGQISIMDTLDRAVFEALGRISWLKAES